jgi:hypothetical protein
MKYEREYKLPLSGGNLHVGVDAKYNWYVELKGREWRPVQISDKPIWVDNRKWEKIPEKLGIDAAAWNPFRGEIQAAEATIEAEAGGVEDDYPDEVRAKAEEILKQGDPIKFFLDVYNQIHVGDRELGEVMLCCIGSQHCENSQGLHPKLSGESGMGKSDAIETFLHQLPRTAYLKTSLSSKAIFYHDIPTNTIIFLDDYKQNDELDSIIKQTSSNFHSTYEHRTIDKDRNSQVMKAPPGIVWAITSVDTSQDIQVLNRQVGLDVDSSEEMTKKVIDHLFEAAGHGLERFPETDEVLICRAMVAEIKKASYKVKVPFWDRIEWNDLSSRRNPSIFLDILKSMTIWNHLQRSIDSEGFVVATEKDFDAAKRLYVGRADTLIDKLTKAERRMVETLVDWNGECYKDVIAQELGVTSQRISQLIYGESGKTGLLQKLPGFEVESVTIKTDARNVTKLNLRFANWKEYERLRAYRMIVGLRKDENRSAATGRKWLKGSDGAKTYDPTDSGKEVVSNVSIIEDIRERDSLSSVSDENLISLISLENGLQPYDPTPDSENKTYDHPYSKLTPSSQMDQTLSEMERQGDGYDVSAMSLEWDMDTDDCRHLLEGRGWTHKGRGLWSPPSRMGGSV